MHYSSINANQKKIGKLCIYTKKSVEPVLLLVPRSKGSGIAQVVETSNAESPT